jgi:hypothetical protein
MYANSGGYFFSEREAAKIKGQYGPEVWNLIVASKVRVGMPEEAAILSWGHPRKVNRTTTDSNTREQWVYGDGHYLYFTNGKLTSIQN